jgi:hypothetical protein
MTSDKPPIACSLTAIALRRRLDEIAALGEEALVGRASDEGVHTLRFTAREEARRRLERVVAAESDCCPFLDLTITERDGELLLAISGTDDGQPVADELAAAFEGRTAAA